MRKISDHIDSIKSIAAEAGREIMRVSRSGEWSVTAKSDDSPLTQADLAANAVILKGLRKINNDPIVSEESDPQSVRVGDRFWLVDPLDGTKDFVAGFDTFVICIARVENGYPTFGLIHAPVTGETWWAEQGLGCFGPNGQRLMHSELRHSLIAVGSRSVPSQRMQMFYNEFKIKDIRRIGSAVKFCKLASGEVDLYPRFGNTSEWDTAAGQVIAEQSGCKVIDVKTGERLRYGKPRFENNGFMASRSDLDLVGQLRAKGLIES